MSIDTVLTMSALVMVEVMSGFCVKESFRNSMEISPLLTICRMITLLGLADPDPVLVETELYGLSMLNSALAVDEVLATDVVMPTPLYESLVLLLSSCFLLFLVLLLLLLCLF